MKPYILWINYGCEGWSPKGFDTPEEALAAIMGGMSFGSEVVLTKILEVEVADDRTDRS